MIHLIDVHQSTAVSNVSANADGIGIALDGTSNITLDSVNVNKMVGTGIVINASSNIALSNGQDKATADGEPPHQEDGLYAVNFWGLHIGGGHHAKRPEGPHRLLRHRSHRRAHAAQRDARQQLRGSTLRWRHDAVVRTAALA